MNNTSFQSPIFFPPETSAGKNFRNVEMAFHATMDNTSGTVITDATEITEIIKTSSGSTTGLFGGTDAGNYIIVGSSEIFEGAKIAYNALATVEPLNIAAEYYKDETDGWSEVYFMGTNADYPHRSHGYDIAQYENENIYFGFNPLTRDEGSEWTMQTFTINGTEYTYYWARFRIETAITGDPVVEQIKFHTDRIDIQATGIFKYGKARNRQLLISGFENTVINAQIDPVNQDIQYTTTATATYDNNELQNTQDDGFLIAVNREFGLDSSVPIVLVLSYYVNGTGTGVIEFTIRSSQVADGYVYDGSNDSVEQTVTDTITEDVYQQRRTVEIAIPINKLEENSGILIEVSRLGASSSVDTLASNVVMTNIAVYGYLWKV